MAGVRLIDLQARFVRYAAHVNGYYLMTVKTIYVAQGVSFLCPKCSRDDACQTHSLLCWAPSCGVPEDAALGTGRWALQGSCLDDLSLMAQQRVIQMVGGCQWRGVVERGWVYDANASHFQGLFSGGG